jgi:hypothetical protein
VDLVGDVHPHRPEQPGVPLAEPRHERKARVLEPRGIDADVDRQDVVRSVFFHLVGDVDDEGREPDDVRGLRIDLAVSRNERAVDEHARATVRAFELDEDLPVGVLRIDREVLSVPVRPSADRIGSARPVAARPVHETIDVVPAVRNADVFPRRVVERDRFGAGRVYLPELPGRRAEVDLHAVGRGWIAARSRAHHDRGSIRGGVEVLTAGAAARNTAAAGKNAATGVGVPCGPDASNTAAATSATAGGGCAAGVAATGSAVEGRAVSATTRNAHYERTGRDEIAPAAGGLDPELLGHGTS